MVGLSQEATTEPVKSGTLNPENYSILWKDTKMQSTPWHLTFLTGKITFNASDKVATGSFDKTAKLWDT